MTTQEKLERLASDNERLRVCLIAVRDRMRDSPHLIMPDGRTIYDFCNAGLIGVTPPERKHAESLLR